MNFSIDGFETKRESNGRAFTFIGKAGDRFTIAAPPTDGDVIPQETHEVAVHVVEALRSLGVLDTARARTAADETLSDLGRSRAIDPIKAAARDKLAGAATELKRLTAYVDDLERRTFLPPTIERGDVEGALIDQEIRNYARATAGKDRVKFAESLNGDPRAVLAVMRSPVPMDPLIGQIAAAAWRENVTKVHPDAQKVVRYRAALEWASSTTAYLETLI